MPDTPETSTANSSTTGTASAGDSSSARAERKLTLAERRRCPRMNSQVAVTLEWNTGGQCFRHSAQTRVIGRYGCMVVVPQNLEVDQQLRITNLASREANPAVVVWRGLQRHEGWELGIELINPETDFWGLEW